MLVGAMVLVCQLLAGVLAPLASAASLQHDDLASAMVLCDSRQSAPSHAPAKHSHFADPAALCAIALSGQAVALLDAPPALPPPATHLIGANYRPGARAPPASVPTPYESTGPPSLV